MLLTDDREIDIFVASKIGSFKHIKYHTNTSKNNKKYTENIVEIKSLQKDDGITSMVWGSEEQTEILLAKKNQQVQIYDTLQGFTKTYTVDCGTGDVVGLGRCKRTLLAGVASGVVKIWNKKTEVTVDTGGKLDRMRVCPEDKTLFATGGEENDLKLWRIGEPQPIFAAKNLANDWLQLRRPVWVSDLTFVEGGNGNTVAVCSRHGYVRLYDIRIQRRPVTNIEFTNMAATCIAPGNDSNHVLVGFGRGQLHLADLRSCRPDKGYKGAAGAVTSAALTHGRVVSAGLDRWIRVHDVETKQMEYKQYLTSKVSCLLVQTKSSTPMKNLPTEEIKEDEENDEEIDDMDQLFDGMETVSDETKKKHTIASLPKEKPKKQKLEAEANETDPDEAIAQLLRSTERQKRKMANKKKEKKSKSVFHNA